MGARHGKTLANQLDECDKSLRRMRNTTNTQHLWVRSAARAVHYKPGELQHYYNNSVQLIHNRTTIPQALKITETFCSFPDSFGREMTRVSGSLKRVLEH